MFWTLQCNQLIQALRGGSESKQETMSRLLHCRLALAEIMYMQSDQPLPLSWHYAPIPVGRSAGQFLVAASTLAYVLYRGGGKRTLTLLVLPWATID